MGPRDFVVLVSVNIELSFSYLDTLPMKKEERKIMIEAPATLYKGDDVQKYRCLEGDNIRRG